MQLSQKETSLLKDLKDQEKLCVDKYNKHSGCASDQQLKDLFSGIAKIEQQHYNTLTQMESGTVPQQSGQGQSQPQVGFKAVYGTNEDEKKKNDAYLCTDLLTTEKHASHLYDTCVFEFKDQKARDTLNHIQKEEQSHGKMIFDYMQTNNMYS
jgi:rubrerythrin